MNKKHPDDWVCPDCGDLTRKHRAHGLCQRCYETQQRRNRGIRPLKPGVRKCVDCGEVKRIVGRDLCSVCYARFYRATHLESVRAYRRHSDAKKNFGGRRSALLSGAGGCELCGMTDDESLSAWGKRLAIHHRDGQGKGYRAPNNNDFNLQILCKSCHSSIHHPKGKQIARGQHWYDPHQIRS